MFVPERADIKILRKFIDLSYVMVHKINVQGRALPNSLRFESISLHIIKFTPTSWGKEKCSEFVLFLFILIISCKYSRI